MKVLEIPLVKEMLEENKLLWFGLLLRMNVERQVKVISEATSVGRNR